ncbi:flagellar biosynthetic protein FliO [Brachyspira sp. SAP_772]|uniref:flagellar biosynthetic protein FliO n=1 Tax=Brachyspira sp. SAP_772 TaxID=2608385 RepID=UPI0012F49037|nr:flagellar biosynthetic protein FliO [Brachyspira sp. SAP_772]
MIKKILLLTIFTLSLLYSQDTNEIIQTNTTQSNYFNIQEDTIINNTNDEPAILQDIRNIENRANVSTTSMFIRAIIGFILTLVGIYIVFMYLKNKTKKISGSNEIIKVLATTAIASNRYVSIIEIANEMYLISVSDHNINLLSKIEDKEMKDQIKMMYVNSKENSVEDSFKNILDQTLTIFKQPKMKKEDALKTTADIREKLKSLNENNNKE